MPWSKSARSGLLLALLLGAAPLTAADPDSAESQAPQATFSHPQFPGAPEVRFPPPGTESTDTGGCNVPAFSIDAAVTNDNRRTTGLVLTERGYFPPLQQSLLTARLKNVQCRKVDGEISVWYSLHDLRLFQEKRFQGRAMFEPFARVRVYGGIAYYTNPLGFFRSRSFFLTGGVEYPSVFGTSFSADYLRDVQQNGDWLTLQFTKRHKLATLSRGAVFYYKHGLGATATRSLPGNADTPSITGIPSLFYRAILEVDDGPVTWYVEASPHVSFVSRATGVRKKHVLIALGVRMDFP